MTLRMSVFVLSSYIYTRPYTVCSNSVLIMMSWPISSIVNRGRPLYNCSGRTCGVDALGCIVYFIDKILFQIMPLIHTSLLLLLLAQSCLAIFKATTQDACMDCAFV